MTPRVQLLTAKPDYPAVVLIHTGGIDLHCGIAYRTAKDELRYAHLAWHLDFRDEQVPQKAWWVTPTCTEDALQDVVTATTLFARGLSSGKVPYAFHRANAHISKMGSLVLGRGHGLTCASLVALLFERAGVPLVNMRSWEQDRTRDRIDEDDDLQRRVVEMLRGKYTDQAALVESQVGCTRLRPEEVAAASGLTSQPLNLSDAAQGAQALRKAIRL